MIVGMAMVPVFTFYFLLEKEKIRRGWTNYLPLQESRLKDELVFVLSAINNYLIVFFRGQVLIAFGNAIMLTIGFLAMGLNYAVFLGLLAGALSIVPYLGTIVTIIPTVLLAAVQFRDAFHPIMVVAIYGLVHLMEGFVISPKVMGDRVGLHPLTIIIAVLVGTTLLGGILGGILAIPLTAALRVLMFRYVWKTRSKQSEV
jgi:predicted PurR-regulated permease PerM